MNTQQTIGGHESDDERHLVSVATGAGFIAAGRTFAFGLRFLMAVLLARWLGVDDYGLYILAISVAGATASFASLGLNTAVERYVAIQRRRDDEQGTRGTLQTGFVGTMTFAVLLAAGLMVLADPIANGVFDEPRLESLLRLAAAITPTMALSTLLISSIRGFKRMDQSALAEDVVQPTTRLVLLSIMALLGMSAFRAGVAFGLSYAVSSLLLLRLVNSQITTRRGDARRDVRDISAFALPFWFSGVLRIARTRLQPLLLGIFGSVANVGVFTVVTSANMMGRVANASIRTSIRPTLAELLDQGDLKEVGRLYVTTTRWTLIAALPVFLVMVLVPESLLRVFGSSFTVGVSALVIVACAEVANAATGMCGPIIAMSEYNRMKAVNSTVWVTISVGTNVLMIPRWGVVGAAVAILASTLTINIVRVVELWVRMRILPWNRSTWKPIAAALGTAALGSGVLTLLPDQLKGVALAATLIGIMLLFFSLLTLLGLEDEDRLVVIHLRHKLAGRLGWTRRTADTPDDGRSSTGEPG